MSDTFEGLGVWCGLATAIATSRSTTICWIECLHVRGLQHGRLSFVLEYLLAQKTCRRKKCTIAIHHSRIMKGVSRNLAPSAHTKLNPPSFSLAYFFSSITRMRARLRSRSESSDTGAASSAFSVCSASDALSCERHLFLTSSMSNMIWTIFHPFLYILSTISWYSPSRSISSASVLLKDVELVAEKSEM